MRLQSFRRVGLVDAGHGMLTVNYGSVGDMDAGKPASLHAWMYLRRLP
jgi:hypothetical protein